MGVFQHTASGQGRTDSVADGAEDLHTFIQNSNRPIFVARPGEIVAQCDQRQAQDQRFAELTARCHGSFTDRHRLVEVALSVSECGLPFVGLYLWTQGALDRAVPLIEEGLTFWRMQKEREQADVATRRAEANAAGATLWDGAFLGGPLTALGWVHLERIDLQRLAPFSMKTPPRPGRRRCRPRGVGAFGTRLPSARGRPLARGGAPGETSAVGAA